VAARDNGFGGKERRKIVTATVAASDIFLGWQRTEEGLDGQPHDFYVRRFRDWKFSLPIQTMVPRGMRLYGELCGWTLARAHARSGDRIAIAAYLGSSEVFENAVAEFATACADQNERDYQALCQAGIRPHHRRTRHMTPAAPPGVIPVLLRGTRPPGPGAGRDAAVASPAPERHPRWRVTGRGRTRSPPGPCCCWPSAPSRASWHSSPGS
jgi:Uncharacterized protein conserved in bacteria (DUF2252)